MEVRIIKGTNQIGGCITEIKEGNTKIIIDFGEDLDTTKESIELDGLTKNKSTYDAVFITHSHGDHIGLINRINENIPVYIEEKSLKIHNLTCDFCSKERVNRKVNTFSLMNNEPIFINSDLKVTPFITDHSSYNSCMYLIESKDKKILHTGDFRNHGRKQYLFNKIIKQIGKVDLLITEGTTLSRSTGKYKTEIELEKEALEIMKEYDQVLILQSSTNIDRTVSFIRAALKTNKKFVLDLFSYYLNKEIDFNVKVDNKKIFVRIPFIYKERKEQWFKDKYLNIETSSNHYPNFVMEVKESMLIDIKSIYKRGAFKNACIIYSMWDGYKKQNSKLKRFLSEIEKMNITLKELHTSGHADLETMKYLNETVNPDNTIIIHTENTKEGINIFNNVITLNDNEIFKL